MNTRIIGRILGVLIVASAIGAGTAMAAGAKPGNPAPDNAGVSGGPAGVPSDAKPSAPPSRAGSVSARYVGDGLCDAYGYYGELCLYYLRDYRGSRSDFYLRDPSLWNNWFIAAGSGQGQVVANNSESFWNRDRVRSWWVYTGANYTGVRGLVRPGQYGNFSSTFINNVDSVLPV